MLKNVYYRTSISICVYEMVLVMVYTYMYNGRCNGMCRNVLEALY